MPIKKNSPLVFDILICLALFFITTAIYFQVKNHEFISFDDPDYITENPHVQAGLTKKSIAWAFHFSQPGDTTYFHPVTWLSHMLDFELFGLSSEAHHLSNVIYHTLNALLLFSFLRLTTGKRWQSAFVAFFFALHPFNVDTVAWVAERKNLVSTFFWLLTMLFYYYYIKKTTWLRYSLIFISMGAGLMAKPMLVTIPCVFLLLDFWPLERFQFSNDLSGNRNFLLNLTNTIRFFHTNFHLFIEKIPFFLLSIIWVYISIISNHNIGGMVSTDFSPMALRVANALISYIKYLWKMIWPANHAIFYPYPTEMPPSWQILGAMAILILISLYVFRQWKQKPWLPVGWLWYLGTLVPVIGITMNGLWPAMADRWAYIPLIGIFIMLVWEGSILFQKHRYIKQVLPVSAILVLFFLTEKTWTQIQHWKESRTLFQHAISVTENNAVAHNYLGRELIEENPKEAIDHLTKAIHIQPNYALAYLNLGRAMKSLNKNNNAEKCYRKAISLRPNFAIAHAALGNLLLENDRFPEAIDHFLTAIQFQPNLFDIHNNLGNALKRQGKIKESITHYEIARKLNPEDEITLYNLATAFVYQNRLSDAIPLLQKAIQINPNFVEAHNRLGLTLEKSKNPKNAIKHYKQAIQIKPDFIDAINNLGTIFLTNGQIVKAIECFSRTLEINPNFASAYNNMGMAMTAVENFDEARDFYEKAIKIDPVFIEAYHNLGTLYHIENNLEKAILLFQSALMKNHGNDQLHRDLDFTINTQKKIDMGINQIKNSINNDPYNSMLYYHIGSLFQKKGKDDMAVAYFQKALSLNSAFAQVTQALASIYKKRNDYIKAISFFKKLVSFSPNNSSNYLEIARLYSKQNKVEQSILWLRKAIEKGLKNWQFIELNSDFASVRQTSQGRKLIDQLKNLDQSLIDHTTE